MSGIFTRGFFAADFARDGATREHFTFHLAKVWRPWRVAESRCFVSVREFQQLLERARSGVHVGVRIADFREALRHREKREVGWVTIRHFMPMKWR